jgi:hypothetical protein
VLRGPLSSLGFGPVAGKQLSKTVDGVTRKEPVEDVGEISLGIDVVQFAGLNEGREDRPMLAAAIGAGEQWILSIKGERTNGAFDDVGIDLDASVLDESAEPLPSAKA